MSSPLWQHQRAAADLLAPLGSGALFLDMGGGKTRTALELIERWQCNCVLILCPKAVCQVWPSEFAKHLDAPWLAYGFDRGTVTKRAGAVLAEHHEAQRLGLPFAVAINYESLIHKPMPDVLASIPWDCLIMDESHRLKAPGGKLSMTAAKLAARIPHRLALTGTPMPHSPLDVYAQFRAVNPDVLGKSFRDFERTYTIKVERQRRDGRKFWQIVGHRNLDHLQDRIAPHVYRVSAADVLDLPPVTDLVRYCLLEPRAQRIYHGIEADLKADLDAGTVTVNNALTKLLRLAQVCNGWVPDDDGAMTQTGTEKQDLLSDLLADLPPSEPLVCFGRFRTDLDAIRAVANAHGRLCGELSGRCNHLRHWQDGDCDVLAVQLHAGGLGVDLTRARYQVYYALDYSLGDYLQTRARIHRPGQTRPVTYIHLLAAGTVDERVMTALQQRQEIVGAVVDGLRRHN